MWKCGPLEIAANVGATRLNDYVPYLLRSVPSVGQKNLATYRETAR